MGRRCAFRAIQKRLNGTLEGSVERRIKDEVDLAVACDLKRQSQMRASDDQVPHTSHVGTCKEVIVRCLLICRGRELRLHIRFECHCTSTAEVLM